MRLLADENFPLVAVDALRRAGYDISWVREVARGSADTRVLALAARERRVRLTFDKDFGALVFHRGRRAINGIILLRVFLPPDELARFVVDTLSARSDWQGNFSVIEPERIRMRRLP